MPRALTTKSDPQTPYFNSQDYKSYSLNIKNVTPSQNYNEIIVIVVLFVERKLTFTIFFFFYFLPMFLQSFYYEAHFSAIYSN